MDYDRIIVELLNRISILEDKVSKLENARTPDPDLQKGSKKYRKLTSHLMEKEVEGENSVKLTFKEIEDGRR